MIPIEQLKPRDIELLDALSDGRFLSAELASTHIWSHRNSANKRLKQLEKAGYIRRTFDDKLATSIIRPTRVGMNALAVRRRGIATSWSWSQLWEREVGFIKHELLVNNVRLVLLQACRQRGDVTMTTRCGPGCVRHVDGVALRPDREIVFQRLTTGRELQLFVEIDRGTRSICSDHGRDVVGQLRLYEHYRSIEATAFRVLMLCPSRQRIENIISAVAASELPGAARRGYGIIDEFLSNPLGSVVIVEGNQAQRCGLLVDWRGSSKRC